jgi:hypothetical protein
MSARGFPTATSNFGQFDWGGLPHALVEDSLHRYATAIAPAVRAATGSVTGA